MSSNFWRDKKKSRPAEILTCEVLNNATIDYSIEDVAETPECYHKGDIRAVDAWNDEYYIDVKDDSRIGGIVNGRWIGTGNVLVEAKVWSYKEKRWLKPNIECDYNALAVVSQDTKHIYIIDFDILKKIYKDGKPYSKDHYGDDGKLSQKTIGTLCSLDMIEMNHGLLYIIEYDETHNPTNIQKIA